MASVKKHSVRNLKPQIFRNSTETLGTGAKTNSNLSLGEAKNNNILFDI